MPVCGKHIRETSNPEETRRFGEEIGRRLRAGDTVAIYGELGSGKTCLAGGIGWGIGVDRKVYMSSPSYTFIKEYDTGRGRVYHVDLYRLEQPAQAYDLPLEDCIYGEGITVIEWADRAEQVLPHDCIRIFIEIVSENERTIEVHPGH